MKSFERFDDNDDPGFRRAYGNNYICHYWQAETWQDSGYVKSWHYRIYRGNHLRSDGPRPQVLSSSIKHRTYADAKKASNIDLNNLPE
jgi:hypothetical protein